MTAKQVYRPSGGVWRSSNGGTITPPTISRVGRITRVRSKSVGAAPPPPDPFVLGVTKPDATNTGWDGTPLTVMNGDQTIPAGVTWTNRLIHGSVVFTDSTSKLVNSVIDGRAPGGTFRAGLCVASAGGGQLDRVTLRPSRQAATNYLDGVDGKGPWIINRCDISGVVDSIHINAAGSITMTGCWLHDYSFWDNDGTHASDAQHPYWSHADVGMQRLGPAGGGGDRIEGCSIEGYFDTTGVVWSGGSWGSGTASGGDYGMPSTALNYVNSSGQRPYVNRNYANLISFTNTSPYTGIVIKNNWLDGGSSPSGMIQFTVGSGHSLAMSGNRFGLGYSKTAAGKVYLATWPSSTTLDQSGAANIYDPDNPNVPTYLQGASLVYNGAGFSVTP